MTKRMGWMFRVRNGGLGSGSGRFDRFNTSARAQPQSLRSMRKEGRRSVRQAIGGGLSGCRARLEPDSCRCHVGELITIAGKVAWSIAGTTAAAKQFSMPRQSLHGVPCFCIGME